MSRTSIPKIFMAGGAVGLTYYAFMRQYWFPNPAKTSEVQNIEDRYTAGGGQPNHQPGTATKRGDSQNTESKQEGASKGPDTEHFDKRFNEQKMGKPGPLAGEFYKTQYENPKSK